MPGINQNASLLIVENKVQKEILCDMMENVQLEHTIFYSVLLPQQSPSLNLTFILPSSLAQWKERKFENVDDVVGTS